MNAVAYATDT